MKKLYHSGDYIRPDSTYLMIDNRLKKTVHAGRQLISYYMFSSVKRSNNLKTDRNGNMCYLRNFGKLRGIKGNIALLAYIKNNYDIIIEYCKKENLLCIDDNGTLFLPKIEAIYYELESEEEISKMKLLTLV